MDTKKIFEKKKDSISIQVKFHKYALLIVSAIKKLLLVDSCISSVMIFFFITYIYVME